jgi:dTDP-4-dehydrorhamnose reductase
MTASKTRVWLVGGKGMLASALAERLGALDVPFVSTDRELDISDPAPVRAFAERERPTLIINSAAYRQVDDAESHEADALRVNANGPENLASAARKVNARLLHFSTDYVFDGRSRTPYVEDAATGPVTAYGRTKLAGEQRVCAVLPEASYIVRTSWLFGNNGPNFVKTIAGLLKTREELRVVDDQHGRPTYTHDLAHASLALLGLGERTAAAPGVYHFANAEALTWHAFALDIRAACEELGQKLAVQRIVAVTTEQFQRPAPRPAYSVLDTSKIETALGTKPRSFRAALREYLRREFSAVPS